MASEPHYNIRAVERLTGVPAPTLRSWERRHGFPAPQRTPTARRLYTEQDVRAIRWVRAQTERGLSVARAIEWALAGGDRDDHPPTTVTPAAGALVDAIGSAVRTFDEQGVETALTSAFAHYPADRVLLDVIVPALVDVGDRWAAGELSVSHEHFLSNLVRRRLLALLAAQPSITPRMTAALACLPGEQHELGLLMLALFLRWAGGRVLYLGANMPMVDLARLAATRDLDAICLSGGPEAHWDALATLVAHLPAGPHHPRIYVGGSATASRPLPPGVHVLTMPLPEAAAAIVTGNREQGTGSSGRSDCSDF